MVASGSTPVRVRGMVVYDTTAYDTTAVYDTVKIRAEASLLKRRE